jgi:N-acetylmuramoyl-L-alanine amidase
VSRRRAAAAAALIGAFAIAGVSVLATRNDAPAGHRVSAVASTTSTHTPSTTAAATTTRPGTTVAATTTGPPTSAAVAAAAAPTPGPAPAPTPAPQPASTGLGAVRGQTIAIDPGHNGGNATHAAEIARPVFIGTQSRACDTTGTQTDDGYTEAAYNLDVGMRLRAVLQTAGANVVMSRTTNDGWGPCIDERAAFANRAQAAVAVSIHADGVPPGGRGFHVNMPALVPGYTDDIYAASHRLGIDMRDAFTATGMPPSTYFGVDGLVERNDLGGLNLSNVPKVFVETGNMRNATDAALLESTDFRQRAADALAAGLARFLAGH